MREYSGLICLSDYYYFVRFACPFLRSYHLLVTLWSDVFFVVFFFLEVLKVIAETTVKYYINILITFKTRSLNNYAYIYSGINLVF